MSNKRFNEQNPASKDGPDSKKEGIKSTGCTKPYTDPKADKIAGPEHARGGAPSGKGGKDLPSPKFTEQKHRQPSGDLPKNGK